MDLYEISESAEEDWRSIVNYTFEQFGETQVRKYMSRTKNLYRKPSNRRGSF